MSRFSLPLLVVFCTALSSPACDDAAQDCVGDECLVVGPVGPEGPVGPPGPALYVNPDTGIEYSVNASPCGMSRPLTGNVGGYSSAKGLCEDVDTCSPSAHVCTAEELVRYASTGGEVPVGGRFATGIIVNRSTLFARDCQGFRSTANSERATFWSAEGPATHGCDVQAPFLCCD